MRCAAVSERWEQVSDRLGTAEVVALAIVDPEIAQQLDGGGPSDKLRHGLCAKSTGDLDDGPDNQLIGGVVDQRPDELAIDLEVVELEVLQVIERRESGAEVVERKTTPELAQPPRDVAC